ncbi:MAG: hypothetical protein IJD43_14715 [Thermoguttaceae bacterium]|nr:hypothetical protein [Thermoguttaceae bacterium]
MTTSAIFSPPEMLHSNTLSRYADSPDHVHPDPKRQAALGLSPMSAALRIPIYQILLKISSGKSHFQPKFSKKN